MAATPVSRLRGMQGVAPFGGRAGQVSRVRVIRFALVMWHSRTGVLGELETCLRDVVPAPLLYGALSKQSRRSRRRLRGLLLHTQRSYGFIDEEFVNLANYESDMSQLSRAMFNERFQTAQVLSERLRTQGVCEYLQLSSIGAMVKSNLESEGMLPWSEHRF